MVVPNGPGLGAHGVDVDPLVVAGGLGEQVDALLVDLIQSLTPISWPTSGCSSAESSA